MEELIRMKELVDKFTKEAEIFIQKEKEYQQKLNQKEEK